MKPLPIPKPVAIPKSVCDYGLSLCSTNVKTVGENSRGKICWRKDYERTGKGKLSLLISNTQYIGNSLQDLIRY